MLNIRFLSHSERSIPSGPYTTGTVIRVDFIWTKGKLSFSLVHTSKTMCVQLANFNKMSYYDRFSNNSSDSNSSDKQQQQHQQKAAGGVCGVKVIAIFGAQRFSFPLCVNETETRTLSGKDLLLPEIGPMTHNSRTRSLIFCLTEKLVASFLGQRIQKPTLRIICTI